MTRVRLDPTPVGTRPPTIDWNTLTAYGIRHPRLALCARLDDALDFFRSGPPREVCLKSSSNLHKARVGLVALGLASEDSVRAAWERLSRQSATLGVMDPLLVQDQVPAGLEVIVGGRYDPVFGPTLLVGLGGTLAEVIDRSIVRLLPVDLAQADDMVRQLLSRAVPGLAELLCAAGELIAEHPGLAELDLNPVILTPEWPIAVDLRIVPTSGNAPGHQPAARTVAAAAAATAAIQRIMAPRSVALIGPSANDEKPGGAALHYLVEYGAEDVHLVHSRRDSIGGIRTVREVRELPTGIDVAVIATPASTVAGTLRQCAERGIGSAIVFASGFQEAGREDMEAGVRQVAAEDGIRVCGVNSIGVIGNLPLTFSRAADYKTRVAGSVSYLTQSGALGGSLLLRSWSQGLGTARFACVGNQTDLSIADYLRYLAADQDTRTVGLFVEGVPDGRDFVAGLHAVRAAGKGLAVLRAGATLAGAAAARSHTGALAGTDELYESAFASAGAYRAADLPELVAACQALDWQPRAPGGRIGVIATSGGACSMLADGCQLRGLTLAIWGGATNDALRGILPSFASVGNPIETTGNILHNPHLLGQLVHFLASCPEADILLVAVSNLAVRAAAAVAEDIIAAGRFGKPIVVCSTVPASLSPEIFQLLRSAQVPIFDSFALGLAAVTALAGAAAPTTDMSGAETRQARDHRDALQQQRKALVDEPFHGDPVYRDRDIDGGDNVP